MEQITKPTLPRWTSTVPPALMDTFRTLAAEQKRSLNRELVWALEHYAQAERRKGKRNADAQDV
jgi:hypothetical protein